MAKPAPLWDRIWEKVIFGDSTECWIWTGARSKKRRGQRRPHIKLGRPEHPGWKTGLVARLMCEMFHGPAPTELHEAGHTCPKGERDDCVNPYHLEWQTREENEQHKQDERRRRDAEDVEAVSNGRSPGGQPASETEAEEVAACSHGHAPRG